MQLEAVVFARFQHGKILPDGKTAGMLIGDSIGLGKGRIAKCYVEKSPRKSKKQIFKTRLEQVIHWMNEGNGLIIFDECHRAKNLLQS